MAKETKEHTEGAAPTTPPVKYVGPKPAPRISNLPGVFGTKAADRLTQEEIAFVIATSAVPNVAKWWTSE